MKEELRKSIGLIVGIIVVVILLTILSGCSNNVVAPRDIGYIAPDVVAPCALLQEIPETNLTMAQVEIYWRADRTQYVACRSSKDELIQTLVDRNISWNLGEM